MKIVFFISFVEKFTVSLAWHLTCCKICKNLLPHFQLNHHKIGPERFPQRAHTHTHAEEEPDSQVFWESELRQLHSNHCFCYTFLFWRNVHRWPETCLWVPTTMKRWPSLLHNDLLEGAFYITCQELIILLCSHGYNQIVLSWMTANSSTLPSVPATYLNLLKHLNGLRCFDRIWLGPRLTNLLKGSLAAACGEFSSY